MKLKSIISGIIVCICSLYCATAIADNTYQVPDWSDYDITFDMDSDNPWYFTSNKDGFYTYDSNTLTGTVDVTDNSATLVFDVSFWDTYGRGYECVLDVYIDGQMKIQIKHGTNESDFNSRFFWDLESGKHTIVWKYSSPNNYYVYIRSIGVERTPTVSVNLLEPGSLGTEVLNKTDHIANVRKLIVKGEMNSDDWARIMMMPSLFSLDLTDATIAEIPKEQFQRSDGRLEFLHEVKLPKTLKKIGDYAFNGLYLDAITFPEGLLEIGKRSFSSTNIKNAILPESVTSIGEHAFSSNQFLTNVSMSPSVTVIPDGCFYECVNLLPFNIPEGIKEIGEYAFYNTPNFDSSIPSTVSTIDASAFDRSGLTNIVLPENVNIGNSSFVRCYNLKTVVLPTSFANDISDLFGWCNSLTDVTFKCPTVVITNNSTIFNCVDLTKINLHVPSYLVNAYKQHSYWYNCNVTGFNTSDVKDWFISKDLVMSAGMRFEGIPNVELWYEATWKISGNDAMKLGSLMTRYWYHYGIFWNASQILSNCENINITGDYNYNIFTDERRWNFVSLPFDMKVGDINCDCSYAIRYYDGASRAKNGAGGNWKNYSQNDVIPAGTGFIYQTSQNAWTTFKAMNNESKQNVFSNHIFTKNLSVNSSSQNANNGWNFIGNPWLCYYNIHKLNFTAPITVWDPNYQTYTAYSIIDDDYALKPNETFFVQCPGADLAKIEFPIDGRQLTPTIESQNGARTVQPSERKLIDIELSNGDLVDKTRIVVNPNASLEYEMSCDASKFFSMNASAPQIFSIENDVQLSINERPVDNGVVQFGLMLPDDGTYTIKSVRNQLGEVFLYDNITGQQTDLSISDYTFDGFAGIDEARFEIRLNKGGLTGISNTESKAEELNGGYYNLNGQRVKTPQKGIYVVNGKKIILK